MLDNEGEGVLHGVHSSIHVVKLADLDFGMKLFWLENTLRFGEITSDQDSYQRSDSRFLRPVFAS